MNKIMLIISIALLFQAIGVSGFSFDDSSENKFSCPNIEYDMVIISTPAYKDSIQPLIDHKISIGIETFFITTDEIFLECEGRDKPEQIKYFIKQVIEEYAIDYVLLIGSFDDIPGRYTHVYFDEPFDYPTPDEWVFTSDFYFADIYDSNGNFSSWDSNENDVFAEYHWNGNTDEIDLVPDVYLGRLACVNEIQVQTCVNKIIQYETDKSWSQNWFTNLVLIAGDGIPFDPESIDESEYLQEQIIDIMDGFIPNCVWASNGRLNNAYNINDAIEDGAGFVFFNGHGLHDLWATYLHNRNTMVPPGSYRTSHINQLTNIDTLPIVISDACYHLQYDMYPDCFGWSFVSNPNGGAIAFIGGSDTDLAYGGTRIVEKGIEKLDLKMCMLYQDGVSHLGNLWGMSIVDYQPVENDIVDLLTIIQNHLFGDPSLQIADNSQPPMKPNPPMGPSEGKIKAEHNFTVITTDPEKDELYYLFDWGDDSLSEWIGPFNSGTEYTGSHTWDTQGTFMVKVKAKDIYGMQSPWSDPLSVSMPKYKSFLDIESNNFIVWSHHYFPFLVFLFDILKT
ncbi:hypothetical protein B6U98_02380 [Thermoplasmatales archaeon ex4572_165]|nr:MAG: hypothetical protein B6U98_02380 [Thermoplasmatales archaeon ex4572_165]